MRFKAIACQVLTREMEYVAPRSPHSVDVELLTMGLHDLGAGMRSHLQQSIDAADSSGYDAILLGYGLCGRGTDGIQAGKTQLVLSRVHDCIGILMGDHRKYQAYFEDHPGVYYRSPGWIEFQAPGQWLQPAEVSAKNTLGRTPQPRGAYRSIRRRERQLSVRTIHRLPPPLFRPDLYLHRRGLRRSLPQSCSRRSRPRGLDI